VAGTPIKVSAMAMNVTDTTLTNLAWVVRLPDGSEQRGTIGSIPPLGTAKFEATFSAGSSDGDVTATVAPSNVLVEPLAGRSNNGGAKVSLVVIAAAQDPWSQWAGTVGRSLGSLIGDVKSQTCVADATIQGSMLQVRRLSPGNPPLDAMTARLRTQGVPVELASAVTGALWDVYRAWTGSYVATIPFAYPAFAVVAAPTVPPTPNTPFSLGAFGGNPAAFSASDIESSIRGRLGARANEIGAAAACRAIASALTNQLYTWAATQQVVNVWGKGPVPSFAPPYVPVGPVVGGDVLACAAPQLW
jgi:hypothetical protein